jgi:radical SAM enzyme (rSAM/lipoprotein system)
MRRILHPLYRHLESRVHPLRYLFVEVTQRCNLECRHCGSDCGRETHFDELSTAEWLAFFGYLPRHFDPGKMMLVVTGGEPLCHPDLGCLAKGLHDNGLNWGMVTNGLGMTPEKLTALHGLGLVSLTISLDGLEGSHDWLRGRGGSQRKALAAIRDGAEAELLSFDVVTCVNPRNLGELDSVRRLLEDAGVPQWRLFTIFPKGRAATNRELRLDSAQLKTMLAWIAAARKEGGPMHIEFSCEGYLDGHRDRTVRTEPYFCRAGISIGSVLCDGSISACPNITRSLVQGNIRNDDFAAVWEERFLEYRDRSWMRTGLCTDCERWRRCQGNSMHLWDDEIGATSRCFHRELCE